MEGKATSNIQRSKKRPKKNKKSIQSGIENLLQLD